ncbi:MAG: hypothetical protein GTO02_07330, partial [Candidatus Dadabacteria bacterium]|nr:hypothetical protein [Candidatus Dadabacteria bacterium]
MGATTAVGVAIIVFLIITLSKYIKQSGDASKRATVMKIQRNLSIAENNSDPVLKDILVFEALDELEELDKGGDLDELTANSNEFYKRINRLIGRSIFQKRDEVLLAGFDDRITGATFNDDDSMIAVSSRDKNNQIRLWKKNDDKWDKHSFNPLDIDKENSEATSNQDFITDIQFNDDGNQLATSSSDGRVKIWDINNSYEIMSLDRKYIITEETINKLKQQNDENKEGKNISEDMIMALEQLASSQQNEIGFVSIDEIVKYANEYRTKINQLGGMTSYITKQSDTRQSDTKQSEYDYVLNQKLRQHVKVIGHEAAITSLDYSSDATKLATAGRDGYLIIWDVSSPNLNNRQIFILKAGHHLNEKYISDLNKKIKDNNSHIILALRKVLADSNSGYVFYSDNELLDKIEDKIGRKLSYNELQLIPRPIGHSNHILDVKFSNDGNVIATSGDDGRIILWDTKTGEIIQVLDRRYIITEDTLINLGNALVNKGSINKEVLSALEQMKSQEQNLSGYSYLEFINTLSENLGGPVSFELEGIIFRDLKV